MHAHTNPPLTHLSVVVVVVVVVVFGQEFPPIQNSNLKKNDRSEYREHEMSFSLPNTTSLPPHSSALVSRDCIIWVAVR